MMEDEDTRPAKKLRLDALVLDPLSVDDLRFYIAELQTEIARAEAAILKKGDARGHAETFFRRTE